MDYEVTPIYKKENSKKECDAFKPVVSIVTPFYNSKDYIEDTAYCVLNQTFPWFEWIIVDDGSKDKESLKKLDKIAKSDARIKVYHKKNEGLAATRDFGAKKSSSTSNYLLFLDDDDLIENNYLECLYYALEINSDACFAYTNTIGFGEINYLWDKKMDIKRETNENLLVATALIRKKDFFEVGGYGTREKGINEDWVFWLKLFSKSKIPLKVNYYGFWYRRKKTGELSVSKNNINITKQLLEEYKDKVDYSIKPIEYPKDFYWWDDAKQTPNPFKVLSKIKNNKTDIIMIMPHIVMGGADKFNIDFIKGLSDKYKVTAIFTEVSDNEWISEIKKYCDTYYILPSFLDRKYWHMFINYLIEKNETKIVFNTNSIYGYMAIPYIRSTNKNIKIFDYVHMEEWYNRNGGYSRDSSAVGSCIDKTLVCNKKSEKILIDYFGRNENDVDTVYIGVDEKKFVNNYTKEEIVELKKKYNVPLDKKVVLFISRIADQKRPYLFAEIANKYSKEYNDCVFLVCGDGILFEGLKNKIKKYDLDNVIFLGAIKNTREIYAISDCNLNCSIKEGLALTTYESLSMGIPVISSDVGGQGEIINEKVGVLIDLYQKEEEVTNYNYSNEEINEYVKAIHRVLKDNNEYRKNCRKRVVSGFTIDLMKKKMNAIVEELMNKKESKDFSNSDVALELLNQYLLESQELYYYSIHQYNKRYDGDSINNQNTNTLKNRFANFARKIHLYNEMHIVKDIIYSIFNAVRLTVKLFVEIFKHIFRLLKK